MEMIWVKKFFLYIWYVVIVLVIVLYLLADLDLAID